MLENSPRSFGHFELPCASRGCSRQTREGPRPAPPAPSRRLPSRPRLGLSSLLVDVRQGDGPGVVPAHALAPALARGRAPVLSPRRVDVRQALVELVGEALEEAVHALQLLPLGLDLPVVVLLDVLRPRLDLPAADALREEHHVHLLVDAPLRVLRVARNPGLQALELRLVLLHHVELLLLLLGFLVVRVPFREVQLDQPALRGAVHAVQHGAGIVLVLLHHRLHLLVDQGESLRALPLLNLHRAVRNEGCEGVGDEHGVLIAADLTEDLLRAVGLRLRGRLELGVELGLHAQQRLLDLRVLDLGVPQVDDHADQRLVVGG
mmetsp:Transcript_23944/g.71244  ORF Transcript_23944/g.71244 Transcript_23944/m.71244 type:complete len:321 (-) Transcript_23944:924-1886(-)